MDQVTIRRVDEAWEEKAREEPVKKTNLDSFAGDSDFGAGWDDFLEKDLKLADSELWS